MSVLLHASLIPVADPNFGKDRFGPLFRNPCIKDDCSYENLQYVYVCVYMCVCVCVRSCVRACAQYCSGDKIENEMGGHVARMGRGEAYTGFWWGNLRDGRPRRRWKYNIGMNIQEVRCGGMDWNELAQDRDSWRALVNEVMNLQVP